MDGITLPRALVALLTTIGLGVLVSALGAPATAAIATGAGAFVLALAMAWGTHQAVPEPVYEPEPETLPSEPTLEELMDAIDEPALVVSGRRVARANPAALALLGDHIVGQDVRLAIRHPAAAERLIGEGPADDGDARTALDLVGIGERNRPWELVIHELSGNNRFVRLADRSRTQAAEKMRVDFVANASHELRTPLSSLLGYIETLQDGAAKDKKTRNRFLGIMQGEARRMQQLIGDLMSLSRIEAERFRPPDEEIAIDEVIEQACAAACSTIGEDPSRIDIGQDGPAETIPGDRVQLAQLVSNLVGNALKYGDPEAPVTVRHGATKPDVYAIRVLDRGEGIAAEHLPRLTERFYRVDPSRSRSMGGTGLGLAIVKHIVERHRGRLDIESEPGRGTRVTVELPKNLRGVSSRRNERVTQSAPSDSAQFAENS